MSPLQQTRRSSGGRQPVRWVAPACTALLAAPAWAQGGGASVSDQIAGAVTQQAGNVLAWVTVLVAVSTLAVALVEFVKAVTDLRRWFHHHALLRWLGAEHRDALPELLYLSIGTHDHVNVLCGQDLPRMMGQVQAAARVALDYPDEFSRLYAFLTDTDMREQVPAARRDPAAWRDAAARTRAAAASGPGDGESAAAGAQARARLGNLVSRKLDGFQLRTDYWWSRLSQLLAMAASAVVLAVALNMTPLSMDPFECFVIVFVGGLLAPFMKDLSQALASFRSAGRK